MEKVILFAVLLLGAAYSLKFEHCEESEGVVPVDFKMPSCSEMPCAFLKGNMPVGLIYFIAVEETRKIDVEVFVASKSFEAFHHADGLYMCRDYFCKYEAGDKVAFLIYFPVITGDYSKEDVLSVKTIFKNENGTPLTCVKFRAKIEDEDESEDTVIHTTMRNEATPWTDPVVQQPLPVEVEKEPVQQSPLPERQEIPEPKEIKLTPRKSYRREEYDTNDELSQRRAKKAAFSMALSSITRLRDDHQVFGDFVASSLRNIRSNKIRRKLRLDIQKSILESSMMDDSEQSSDNA